MKDNKEATFCACVYREDSHIILNMFRTPCGHLQEEPNFIKRHIVAWIIKVVHKNKVTHTVYHKITVRAICYVPLLLLLALNINLCSIS